MARTGRPRIPTHLKILRGNPGKRAADINTEEPKPPVVIPSCPKHVQGEARKEWRRITKELATLELIAKLDRAAVAAYCVQWARWVEAENKLTVMDDGQAVEPTVFKTPTGYPMQSPWLSISNKALELMHKFLTEFGLTAASRTRLKVETKKPEAAAHGAKRFLTG